MNYLEEYFDPFRQHIIGYDQTFETPYGVKRIIYSDWTASGRLYEPIEKKISETFGPFVGNTHSESSVTGTAMTRAYHAAHEIIKEHVHADACNVILTTGFGMTAAVSKFQRILGLKIPEQLKPFISLPEELRPVVFITHMEHHSNQTSWLETIADVVCLEPNNEGTVDGNSLIRELEKYKNRRLKIGSFTACSNVTGIRTPIHALATIMHEHGGYCIIDFAAAAPYVDINMHPDDPMKKLDAIYFSPHKFLGGPGSSGVLIFDSKMYENKVPDDPGGGTVKWTNPWGGREFYDNIEVREDGGTPGFLQAIRTALCIQLKNEMNVEQMLAREEHLVNILFRGLRDIPGLHILADHIEDRLGIISFYVDNIHYNLIVKLLNDRFGIQTRGGCSCAGTYGHYLLHVDELKSKTITDKIHQGDLSEKPGWVRVSLHPTLTDDEVLSIVDGVKEIVAHIDEWSKDYNYDSSTNEFSCLRVAANDGDEVDAWFRLPIEECIP